MQKDSQMKVEVKTTNMDMTPAISEYITKKLVDIERMINVKEDTEVLAEIEVGKTTEHHQSGDNLFKAEMNLTISGSMYRSVAKKADIYEAIDEMKDEIMRLIKKDKEKIMDGVRKGGRQAKEMLRDVFNRE
jgi:ribosomal subunit interface protein